MSNNLIKNNRTVANSIIESFNVVVGNNIIDFVIYKDYHYVTHRGNFQ